MDQAPRVGMATDIVLPRDTFLRLVTDCCLLSFNAQLVFP
jgi:hypothetical protein